VHYDLLYSCHHAELFQGTETLIWCTLHSNKQRKRRSNNKQPANAMMPLFGCHFMPLSQNRFRNLSHVQDVYVAQSTLSVQEHGDAICNYPPTHARIGEYVTAHLGRSVSALHTGSLYPTPIRYPWCLFLLEAESTPVP